MQRDRSELWITSGSALIAFGQGVLAIVLAIELQAHGLSLLAVGRVLSAGVFGSALYLTALMFGGGGIPRRSWLVGLSTLSALAVAGIATLHDDYALLACALVGALSGGTATGAWHPLVQDLLAQSAAPSERPRVFARYRLSLALAAAAGSTTAGVPSWLPRFFPVDERWLQSALLPLTAFLFAASALCFASSSRGQDAAPAARFSNPLHTPSRNTILTLCSLFGVDQLGSSLANTSLVTLWFHERHGLGMDSVGLLLGATFVLNAVSMWLSGRIAPRLGLVPTMVFTHIPACVLLIIAAFAPSAGIAVGAWLLRALLSNMDVPPRDAFTMAVVAPEERVTMASAQLLAKSALGTPGPMLATLLWQGFGPAAPFALGGALKIAYDLSLYALFRRHPASQPAQQTQADQRQ